ncbi:MAG: hypothetical protein JWN74_2252 [Acidobacteriaceae bacterium]|nr:hypothetical protein [Acidobacteriaceae bacterium]
MIMDGLPESQPEIQNTQPAGQAAHKPTGNEVAQIRRRQQKWIVGPSRGPRKDNQQHPKCGTNRYQQQRANPQKP